MIQDFEDLCLYVYCLVDDIWKGISHRFNHRRRNLTEAFNLLRGIVLANLDIA